MTEHREPLPIWFFVGLILTVYGVIVLASGLIYPHPHTVLAHLRPALWWGAIILAAGILFVIIGVVVHRRASAAPPEDAKE
jgi:hypothetical protein